MLIQEKIAFYLEDIETPIGRIINLIITGLVLLSSAIFVAETYKIPELLKERLDILENGILLIFVVEYFLRFWCAKEKRKYFFSLYSIIDLITILPFLIGSANTGFLRIFRWFRILRLIRFMGRKTIFGYVSSEDSAIFTRILFTLFSIIFVYSGLIYQVEHSINSQAYGTFLDAVYFSVSTITTAGLGDITPVSQLGRFFNRPHVIYRHCFDSLAARRFSQTSGENSRSICPGRNCLLGLWLGPARFRRSVLQGLWHAATIAPFPFATKQSASTTVEPLSIRRSPHRCRPSVLPIFDGTRFP